MAFADWLKSISRLGRRPLTRAEAADLIEEFCELKWDYSDAFDMNFGDLFGTHDPVMESVAKEFLEIQADYERNANAKRNPITTENLNRLRSLISQLRA